MKHYEFEIWHSGYGETAEEAWQDSFESFVQDPGGPSDNYIVQEVDPDTYEEIGPAKHFVDGKERMEV